MYFLHTLSPPSHPTPPFQPTLSSPHQLTPLQVANSPPYFPRLWALLKHFIDPRTTSKITFLTPSETLPRLSETIAPENIPVQFGGKFEYEPGATPVLDEGLRRQLRWVGEERDRLPEGPLKWVVRGGRRVAVRTGRDGGREVCEGFAGVVGEGEGGKEGNDGEGGEGEKPVV